MQHLMYLIHYMNTSQLRYSGYENNKPSFLGSHNGEISYKMSPSSTLYELHTHNEAEKCISYQFLTSLVPLINLIYVSYLLKI